jgi:hypothetical protein
MNEFVREYCRGAEEKLREMQGREPAAAEREYIRQHYVKLDQKYSRIFAGVAITLFAGIAALAGYATYELGQQNACKFDCVQRGHSDGRLDERCVCLDITEVMP